MGRSVMEDNAIVHMESDQWRGMYLATVDNLFAMRHPVNPDEDEKIKLTLSCDRSSNCKIRRGEECVNFKDGQLTIDNSRCTPFAFNFDSEAGKLHIKLKGQILCLKFDMVNTDFGKVIANEITEMVPVLMPVDSNEILPSECLFNYEVIPE